MTGFSIFRALVWALNLVDDIRLRERTF